MNTASLIGFTVALLLMSWIVSATAFGLFWGAQRAIRRRGPIFERAMCSLALVAGPGFAAVAFAALLGHSLVHMLWAMPDHCLTHSHHLHLCLVHGRAWADQIWAIAIIVGAALGLAALTARSIQNWWNTRSLLRVLMRNTAGPGGECVGQGAFTVSFFDSETTFCFVAGIRKPRLFIASRVWDALGVDERKALLAHEAAHVFHRDLLWRSCLRYFAYFCVPVFAQRIVARWHDATEKVCDLRAAEQVDKITVAQALVKIARLVGNKPVLCGISFAARAKVSDRVEAVLADQVAAQNPRARIKLVAAIVAISLFALAEYLHHAVETVLGIF